MYGDTVLDMNNKHCEYEDCQNKIFATEKITGSDMGLCVGHFRKLFWKLIRNAKVINKKN
jgi:hypothetical protein